MSAPYELTENQELFIEDAENQGFDVEYTYSGRFMYGKQCPAVRIDYIGEFGTEARVASDNMGLGYIVYCPA